MVTWTVYSNYKWQIEANGTFKSLAHNDYNTTERRQIQSMVALFIQKSLAVDLS